MEYFVVADEDTVLGFRYAGVDGRVVHTPAEARAALREIDLRESVGIIIVTDEIARSVPDEVDRIRFDERFPLIVQIPNPDGPAPDRQDLMGLIREALGIRL